ncbi:isochorismatase family protein [Bosea thiooxidans]|nr:isochorismatase family protein [Bosea sp. (in: a-proteobacteria)]
MTDLETNYSGVWGHRIGFGNRPALVLIDFVKAYTTPGAPLYAPGVVDAVAHTVELLMTARSTGVPVIHTRILYLAENCVDGGAWVRKAPVMKSLIPGARVAEFCDSVAPRRGELVVTKQYASAFFGTTLAQTLHASQVDTVVFAGCSTSGCIRASVVDAVQHGFHAIVARECVGDRHPAPHEASLFDIDSKYGDVINSSSVINYFKSDIDIFQSNRI